MPPENHAVVAALQVLHTWEVGGADSAVAHACELSSLLKLHRCGSVYL